MAFVVAGIIVIAVVVNVLLWLFLMPRYVKRRISGFQNELVDRHYDEVEVMYRKMRGWRHDYHNHIQVLKTYLSLTQYREALDYLDGLEKDLSAVDTVLKTGDGGRYFKQQAFPDTRAEDCGGRHGPCAGRCPGFRY